jgi:hypothetical protein
MSETMCVRALTRAGLSHGRAIWVERFLDDAQKFGFTSFTLTMLLDQSYFLGQQFQKEKIHDLLIEIESLKSRLMQYEPANHWQADLYPQTGRVRPFGSSTS